MEDIVISADGTTVGYRQFGHGPGLVVVHGSMSTGLNQTQLAQALSADFTVYLVDRRGRGLTGPYRPEHTVQADVADVTAVLDKTGAELAFGVSVGGIVCLEALLAGAAIRRLAVYEPPLFPGAGEPATMTDRIERELTAGKVAAALTTAMQGAQLGPGFLNAMPHWLATRLTAMMMRASRSSLSNYVSFADLALTLAPEGRVIAEASRDLGRYREIGVPVLLLGGSRSSQFLKSGVDRLRSVLPDATRVEIPGADHSAAWNADLRGKPELVAAELKRFFSAPV